MLVMLERRLLTDASSSSPPEVQSEPKGTGAALGALLGGLRCLIFGRHIGFDMLVE